MSTMADEELTVRIATSGEVVRVTSAQDQVRVTAGSVPDLVHYRDFPAFADASKFVDPNGLIASAEDLESGVKRILTNPANGVAGQTPDDGNWAYWLWPLEDVHGRPASGDDRFDLRRWGGLPRIAEAIGGSPPLGTDWSICMGVVYVDPADPIIASTTRGVIGGFAWDKPYTVLPWEQECVIIPGRGPNGWIRRGHSGGGERWPHDSLIEMTWTIRGAWVYSPHVSVLRSDGTPLVGSEYEMAGGNDSFYAHVPSEPDHALHLVLGVCSPGGTGEAMQLDMRAYHDFHRKRYPS